MARTSMGSAVDVAAVADLDHDDHENFILDFVNDPVVALPDPVVFLAGKLRASRRARILAECFDAIEYFRSSGPGIFFTSFRTEGRIISSYAATGSQVFEEGLVADRLFTLPGRDVG